MVTFCLIVAPLPYAVRKRLFRFLSESPIVAKVAYGLKISFMYVPHLLKYSSQFMVDGICRFVGILFVDALQRMFRVTAEVDLNKQRGVGSQDVRTETGVAARKFYAQRNVYLTGFTLFLSLVLTRSFYIILDLIHTQEEYAKLKRETAGKSRTGGSSTGEVEELKRKVKELEAKDRDFGTASPADTSFFC